jgi:hypothetical protein
VLCTYRYFDALHLQRFRCAAPGTTVTKSKYNNMAMYLTTLNSRILKINTFMKSVDRIWFVIILTVVGYTVSLSFDLAVNWLNIKDIIWINYPMVNADIVLAILAVTLGPLFETWLGQSLPYRLLNKVKRLRERQYLILIIAALFFGINHFYSLLYIIFGSVMGVVLMYGYMVRVKTDSNTFYLIAITHSLLNMYGSVAVILDKTGLL